MTRNVVLTNFLVPNTAGKQSHHSLLSSTITTSVSPSGDHLRDSFISFYSTARVMFLFWAGLSSTSRTMETVNHPLLTSFFVVTATQRIHDLSCEIKSSATKSVDRNRLNLR